ncbi:MULTISPECIES: S53 family peptidase [Streptomycetaceae]|uniref:Serine protease n=1 Tax=Streptantibioticus cattleyicolor (strain ATCC 35852 / DSM 46488 / JCM 4925 / NBRC 14057 / NRRL 8057) TaxID=1003195 RepID=F8JP36_STREN|nr:MULTISPECIES: S53 family peptidase [Streptomycetaceae]AEW93992.1 serine protease [Streptantibioticus cattleyicolor NRRL 8057 = DSM 46488]MYS58665.1 S8 family serine peptidase [Streptomyces sp. SID5468]CCB74335.1 Serine protease [Streptantibioticus cattleyicolor NRRL 8057 = DSM 46488]
MKLDRHRTRAGLAAAATLPLVAGALALGIPSAQAAPHDRLVLTTTKPLWATPRADHGSAAASTTVHARVYLAGRDAKGLAAYAQAVSDPKSPLYGKYLTAKQAQARFGATPQQIADVTRWLKSAGLTVTATTQHYVAVSGDKAAVQRAFGTDLHNYTKDGRVYHAPAKAASVPASVADAVLTVSGLDNAPKLARHDNTTDAATSAARPSGATPGDTLPPPEAVFKNAGPFSTYYGSKTNSSLPSSYGVKAPYAVHGYTGKQLRAAYGAGKWTGKGVTIAITDAYASPYIAKDAAEYAKRNGDAPYRPGQFGQVLPGAYNSIDSCKAAGWYGEETLDVEAVHAVAPAARITYVGAASCGDSDLMDALTKVVDNRLADIVSNSWGDVEANETPDVATAYDHIFQQGAVEGIGFYFSSGDNGDEVANTGTKQVDTPANSAWVTAVGGTSLAVGKGNKYLWETGWGTYKATLSKDGQSWDNFPGAYTSGAGGGTSRTVDQPFYQRGVVPDALSKQDGPAPKRVVPDIAAIADPNTGFLVGQSQTFPDKSVKYSEYRIGGTSLAAPVISAIQALAQQARGGVPIGFANPGIYDRYGTAAYHDVTDHPLGQGQGLGVIRMDYANGIDASGGLLTSLRSLGKDSSLNATVGYDNVTGVGTPAAGYVNSYVPRRH